MSTTSSMNLRDRRSATCGRQMGRWTLAELEQANQAGLPSRPGQGDHHMGGDDQNRPLTDTGLKTGLLSDKSPASYNVLWRDPATPSARGMGWKRPNCPT